ncbi:DUF421 domain-containing protein [Rubrivirga sp.]|uniref:DUF421 domain-containing protein n=1 Tax=Rubrivirga sp. TaxID=1885344 RepID=UPI003B523D0E
MADWFTTSWSAVAAIALSAVAVYALILVYTRIAGLRSFAKMSSFDFAMTVAVGSSLASAVLTQRPTVAEAAVGLGVIYALQWSVGRLRHDSARFQTAVDNEPLLLMDGDQMIREHMHQASITEDDLWGRLREANVLDVSQVRAVVLETTGDISVLHGDPGGLDLQPRLLSGVRGADRHTDAEVDLRPSTDRTV